MVLQEITSDRLENAQFLTFDDAVIISRRMEEFFNSSISDQMLIDLAQKFNLGIKKDFFVNVPNIEKNCKECMGCKSGEGCILGCFITEPGQAARVCFWDEAIEAVIGSKLIVHEYGHVIFDQIFTNELSSSKEFDVSEKFAQFFEENFTLDFSSCSSCSSNPLSESNLAPGKPQNEFIDSVKDSPSTFLSAIILGIGLGIGAAFLGVIVNQYRNVDPNDDIGLL